MSKHIYDKDIIILNDELLSDALIMRLFYTISTVCLLVTVHHVNWEKCYYKLSHSISLPILLIIRILELSVNSIIWNPHAVHMAVTMTIVGEFFEIVGIALNPYRKLEFISIALLGTFYTMYMTFFTTDRTDLNINYV